MKRHTFKTMISADLSADDHKVLVLLYQPIMGINSYSLYLSLFHLVNKQNYKSDIQTHSFLFDLLNIKEEEFTAAKDQLEALNLLESYVNKTEHIYVLKNPLSAKQFLSDTIFGQFLLCEIGENMYLNLTRQFELEKEDFSQFKNVTKQFDDLYEFKPINIKDNSSYIGRRNNGGVSFESNFDYEKFTELLPERLKKPILVNWKTVEYINKLSFVYQIDEREMSEIYIQAATPNGDVVLTQLNLKAKNYYDQISNHSQTIIDKKIDDSTVEMIEYLKKATPQRIIKNYCKNNYQAVASDTVMQLMERNQVELGVINVLLIHILKYKDGILPNINYLEKVLETWSTKGIITTEAAYNLITEKETLEKSKTHNKKSKDPEWLDDYLKELDKWGTN
ncbi:Replication initiation and membrane attachment protein DnaB [Alteracholeplasma palmae J233]|uniref:Replication initiation and membrane attachment protein DnaB n=1 Tax=Alteracholeplasma palmae (strain ATCC 49389 / J233) TaxID=1318466 RepID=U4KK64_ALTPJ|nr:DnaD domain protein [Alteracholeplasma palmae]CCV64059.1 Replication initiation and membrane attachment protein DnaB [Alteracholeplasma palmae J233]